ncbi:uncharacterized protein YdeI (YjbR/CyaY-like superfamily) [Chitinophaga skermanii]|uniref:Uncharacterized protein YdeI (YjbR/CyaY-like superfamily) n=1 Tax=Chitinophaga skermanii TaxID=331697 RepID=A0A327QSL2_9BACT|nr:YdeI/OmpD-associated family protein [Chitinophaga skermanii]RAJ06682.1 uncharacterized protein YdeI (YjbR/CyaY-like superfamily) [Chitinophaga skermanii]
MIHNATPHFFKDADEAHKWFAKNHDKATELVIGFYKTSSKKTAATYSQVLDEALCYGWIDAVRKSIDADSYMIRFTKRKPNSIWSNINVQHMTRLLKEKRVQPAGKEVYDQRKEGKTGVYAFENKHVALDPAMLKRFKANKAAYAFYEAQAPHYQRTSAHWVMSAKREETREKRLLQLIEDAENKLWIAHLRRN